MHDDALGRTELQHVMDGLQYANNHPIDSKLLLEDFWLGMVAEIVFDEEDALIPPTITSRTLTFHDPVEELLAKDYLNEELARWERLLQARHLPFPDRHDVYTTLGAAASKSWNKWHGYSIAAEVGAWDQRITAHRSRLLLLQLAAAYRLFSTTHGRTPETLPDLQRFLGDPMPTDPLTGGSFVMTRRDGHVHLATSFRPPPPYDPSQRVIGGEEDDNGGDQPFVEIRLPIP